MTKPLNMRIIRGKYGKIIITVNQIKGKYNNKEIIRSEEKIKEIFLEYIYRIKPNKDFPLNLWEQTKEFLLNCDNFQYTMIIGEKNDLEHPFTFTESVVYINKFCH